MTHNPRDIPMANPLENCRSDFWATPADFGAIQDLIEASDDPATCTHVMMMTINLCARAVDDAIFATLEARMSDQEQI